jgi:hypothetical protein
LRVDIILAAISLIAYGGMVSLHLRHGTLRDSHTPDTLIWYGVAFMAYLVALWWAERRRTTSWVVIWAAAIAFRVLLLFTVPSLSDDIYRYLWDGYVANNGVNPYAYAIDSAELDYLDIPLRALTNNRGMASPYLPTAQYLFVSLTRLFPLQPVFLQIAMVIFDLASAVLIYKLLLIAKLPGYRILIYLWNPLVVVEIAHGAHVDAWMIFLSLLALWLTFSQQRSKMSTWLAPVLLALATLTKILPVLLLPILFWRWRWGQLAMYGLVTAALLVPAGLQAGWGLIGPLDGTGLFGAIRIYADQWNFNSGIFHWLEVDLLPALGVIESTDWAKRILILSLLIVLIGVWYQARHQPDIRSTLRLMAGPYMAYVLLNTTLHPWYVLILMAFLPFLPPLLNEAPWRWLVVVPWLYLSGAVWLSYLTYLDPLNFRELEWVRRTEWLPTLGFCTLWLIILAVKRVRAGSLLVIITQSLQLRT